MAFTLSRSRIMPVLAKVETTYGTDPTPAGGTDDVLCIASPNPVNPRFVGIELRPHSSTFTRPTQIIGIRTDDVALTFLLAGSGTIGAVANGYTGTAALLKCCGIKEAISAGVSITLSPQTVAGLQSATAWFERNGMLQKVSGLYANCVFSGSPSSGVECKMTGTGIYQAETIGTITGFVATNRAQACLGIAGTITPNGSIATVNLTGASGGTGYVVNDVLTLAGGYNGTVTVSTVTAGVITAVTLTTAGNGYSTGVKTTTGGTGTGATINVATTTTPAAYTGVLQSFSFDLGNQIVQLPDMNASTGLSRLVFADKKPMLRVTMALDADSGANLSIPNLHANLTGVGTHSVTWKIGSGTGLVQTWTFPTAQLLDLNPTEINGAVRGVELSYNVQHVTPESEWSIVIAST